MITLAMDQLTFHLTFQPIVLHMLQEEVITAVDHNHDEDVTLYVFGCVSRTICCAGSRSYVQT